MKKAFLFLLMIWMIASCRNDTVITPLYEGRKLKIGVIGDAPDVREEHITFNPITFDEMAQGKQGLARFDAVFIMKEHHHEAAESPYAKVYRTAGIPFFYIESEKSHIPFVHEDIAYDDADDFNSGDFAAGYYQTGRYNGQGWSFGLYNDKKNKPNVLGAYTQIFITIESLKP